MKRGNMSDLDGHRPLLYVASPLSDTPQHYLEWVGRMNDEAEYAFEQGWAPMVPGNDLLFCYRSKRKFEVDDLLEIDREMIRASWAIRVIDTHHVDGRESYGVKFELRKSKEFGVDICMNREDLAASYERWTREFDSK